MWMLSTGSVSRFHLRMTKQTLKNLIGIRTAILEGDVDKALKYTTTHYPNVLKDHEQIYFRLRCRKFIEMIKQCSELLTLAQSTKGKRNNNMNGHSNELYDDVFEHEMELDD